MRTAFECSYAGPFYCEADRFLQRRRMPARFCSWPTTPVNWGLARFILELLPCDKITVIVKGGPAIHDALRADAAAAGFRVGFKQTKHL